MTLVSGNVNCKNFVGAPTVNVLVLDSPEIALTYAVKSNLVVISDESLADSSHVIDPVNVKSVSPNVSKITSGLLVDVTLRPLSMVTASVKLGTMLVVSSVLAFTVCTTFYIV